MLLIHDLVEIYAGDTYAYDEENKRTQNAREIKAAEKLFALLPKDQEEKFNLYGRNLKKKNQQNQNLPIRWTIFNQLC